MLAVFVFVQIPKAQDSIKIFFHGNNYKGNLYTRVFDINGNLINTKWFYVKNSTPVDSVFLLQEPNGFYQLYNGFVSFTFHKDASNKIFFDGPLEAAQFKDSLSTVVLSFNTAPVTIKNNGLSIPYMLSAYALIPSLNTTDGTKYNVIYHDTTITLIRGMEYAINNQTYRYLSKSLFISPMPCNKKFIVSDNPVNTAGEPFTDDIGFKLNAAGHVENHKPIAASTYNSTLIFNTVSVDIDPLCISNGNRIGIPHDLFTGLEYITQKKRIRVIYGLLNYLRWIDVNGLQHDYYYAPFPPKPCKEYVAKN